MLLVCLELHTYKLYALSGLTQRHLTLKCKEERAGKENDTRESKKKTKKTMIDLTNESEIYIAHDI